LSLSNGRLVFADHEHPARVGGVDRVLQQVNEFTVWMHGMMPYLTVQQRADIHMLKLGLTHDERTVPRSEKWMNDWTAAEMRVFPGIAASRRGYRLRRAFRRARGWVARQKAKVLSIAPTARELPPT
jgi:hypothetical protein